MALIKNEIPILEYDDNPSSVLMPDHEHLAMHLPERAVFAFLEDTVDQYAKQNHAQVIGHFVSATKVYPVYVLDHDGVEVCLMQAPVGAPARFIHVLAKACEAIERTLKEHGLSYSEVTTWSTDGFYRETREKVIYRKSEECSVVEMECSALAACAEFRGVEWGELLFAGDTLANLDQHDERGFGIDSRKMALQLSIEAVCCL